MSNFAIFLVFSRKMLVLNALTSYMTLLVLVITIHYLYHKYCIFYDYRPTILSAII